MTVVYSSFSRTLLRDESMRSDIGFSNEVPFCNGTWMFSSLVVGGMPLIHAATSFAVGIPVVLYKFLPTLTCV